MRRPPTGPKPFVTSYNGPAANPGNDKGAYGNGK